jgi:hypothetical protein
VPIVLKSGSLNLLAPSGPVKACNGIALPFYPDHGRYGDLPLQGKIPTAELGIEPGTSWLVVRSCDHQATMLVTFYANRKIFFTDKPVLIRNRSKVVTVDEVNDSACCENCMKLGTKL